MSSLSDLVGIDIAGLAGAAVQYQIEKNKANASGLDTTIDQLRGTVSIYETTNRQLADALKYKNETSGFVFDTSSLIKWGAIGLGVFFVYKLVK